jgi:carbon-monoxide dehydrogenase large subunit
VIGRPVRRVEDRALLTGRACFVDDVRLPGTLHAAFLRSPLAHAVLASVEADEARELPGVATVLTGADLALSMTPPLTAPGARSPARPLLARDHVRFAGEPVAMVVAASRYVAEDAVEVVAVEYEPLPAVAGVEQALAPDAPALHPPDNVLFDSRLEAGDVDAAFAGAAVVVEATLRNPRVGAVPMEPRGVLAAPDGGRLTVWSSTQAPHGLRTFLAEVLELDPAAVRVVCPDIGGGFGQKAHCYPEEALVAAAALRLGRPVRWTEDRSENLQAASHARDQVVRARAAADAEGRLLAIDADVACDTGAYGVFPHGHVLEALGTPAMIPGPYRLPAYRARSRSVATNKCPEGAYRGVGLPVSVLVHERLLDLVAGGLGRDRAEVRLRNFVRPEDFPYTTHTQQQYDNGDYGQALRVALDAIGYAGFEEERERARREGRTLGIGIGSYVEYTGMGSAVFAARGMVGIPGHDGAFVRLAADGSAAVWTSLPAMGQGSATTFAQLVAEELGVDAVRVANPDTSVGDLSGTGTFASRSAVSGGGAIAGACAVLRSRLREDAAELLEAAPEDLVVREGAVQVVGTPGRRVTVGDVVAASPDARYAVAFTYDPPAVAYPYATHACVVEVDRGTGGVRILRYAIAEDCGRVINPTIVAGQVHGATAQGIGGALLEQLVYDAEGQLLTTSLLDYLLPLATDLPRLDVRHLEIPAPGTANGAKGVGEGGALAPPAAIAGAVADALGAEITELPLTPERVRALAGLP